MNYTREMQCCGLAELADIAGNTPERIVRDVATCMFDEQDSIRKSSSDDYYWNENSWENAECQCPFLIFSDIREARTGKALAKYIRKHKLGAVYGSQARVNVRSGNKLRCWVWTVKKQALKKWLDNN